MGLQLTWPLERTALWVGGSSGHQVFASQQAAIVCIRDVTVHPGVHEIPCLLAVGVSRHPMVHALVGAYRIPDLGHDFPSRSVDCDLPDDYPCVSSVWRSYQPATRVSGEKPISSIR